MKEKNRNFVIITGISGAGKTKASNFLEDMGYFCIDNLPLSLIKKFVELYKRGIGGVDKVSLTIDIREKDFTKNFPKIYKELEEEGLNPFLLFLDAGEETLVKRYKETRRKHPLFTKDGLITAIRDEKLKLKEIKDLSDVVIDTSKLKPSELKQRLIEIFKEKKETVMSITIISFGYKYGIPIDSDIIFDVRFLPNPFYINGLREVSGLDEGVKRYVLSHAATKGFLKRFKDMIFFLIPQYVKEGKTSLIISFGCTGGKHRSVVISEEVQKILEEKGYKCTLFHRDIRKE